MPSNIRSVLFAIYLPLSAVILGTLFSFTFLRRDWAWFTARLWNRSALTALHLICGTKYQILHPDRLSEGPTLYAANHQSMMETMVLALELDRPCIVLKRELLSVPFFGWYCRRLGFIGIDRDAGASAMRDMIKRAKEAQADGRPVVIFPEGSRTPPGETTRYHPGVAGLYAGLGVPCIPVAHNAGLLWTHPGLTRLPGTVTFSIEDPIAPALKRKEFMANLEGALQKRVLELAELEPHNH